MAANAFQRPLADLNAFVPSQQTSQMLAPKTNTPFDPLIQAFSGISRKRDEKAVADQKALKDKTALELAAEEREYQHKLNTQDQTNKDRTFNTTETNRLNTAKLTAIDVEYQHKLDKLNQKNKDRTFNTTETNKKDEAELAAIELTYQHKKDKLGTNKGGWGTLNGKTVRTTENSVTGLLKVENENGEWVLNSDVKPLPKETKDLSRQGTFFDKTTGKTFAGTQRNGVISRQDENGNQIKMPNAVDVGKTETGAKSQARAKPIEDAKAGIRALDSLDFSVNQFEEVSKSSNFGIVGTLKSIKDNLPEQYNALLSLKQKALSGVEVDGSVDLSSMFDESLPQQKFWENTIVMAQARVNNPIGVITNKDVDLARNQTGLGGILANQASATAALGQLRVLNNFKRKQFDNILGAESSAPDKGFKQIPIAGGKVDIASLVDGERYKTAHGILLWDVKQGQFVEVKKDTVNVLSRADAILAGGQQ
jgi:hypothetical protein